ncbi:MAG: hypothetical protein FJ279_34525, partial [Planctomycetes bacterium]|nr:hypothetical protein [Planctomycetota bacterium]
MRSKLFRSIILAVLATWGAAALCHGQASARALLKASGMAQGLCAVVGCGDAKAPALAAELAASGKWLVHGIALDDAALDRAARAISAAGADGLATVEKLPLRSLPYRDNLINLLVVVNPEAAGLSPQEALRVVAPDGKLCILKDGKWDVTAKPMPKEMDEWTHEAHGPDGNCVSKDTMVHFPVGFRWHAGLPMNLANPKRTANAWSSIRGVAVAGGRVFTLSDSVLENLGPTYASEHGLDQYVTARDAFNGLLLWRRNIGATYYGGLFYPNRAPFAAVGDSVYVASGKGKLLALTAATGDLDRSFATTYAPGVILVDQGLLAAATWKEGARVGGLTGVDRRRMTFSVGEGTVEAFDAQKAKRLWKLDKLATSLRSADGILFGRRPARGDAVPAAQARRNASDPAVAARSRRRGRGPANRQASLGSSGQDARGRRARARPQPGRGRPGR